MVLNIYNQYKMKDLLSKTEMLNYEFLKEICTLNKCYSDIINHNSVEMFTQKGSVEDLFSCFMDINKLKFWNTLEAEYELEKSDEQNLLTQKRKKDTDEAMINRIESNKDISTQFSDSQIRKAPLFKFMTKRDSEQQKPVLRHLKLIRKPKSGEHKLKLKLRSDCIRKRIKSMLNSYIISSLNGFLNSISHEEKLFNLPKDFNIDIKTENNRQLLNSTVLEVFSLFPANPTYFPRVEHNKKLMATCLNPEFQVMLNRKLKDLYNEYLESERLKADLIELTKKEGDAYIVTFKNHLETFLSYFGVN